MNRKIVNLICILIVFAIVNFAPSDLTAGLRINFDKDNQTYNWQTAFQYKITKNKLGFITNFDGRSNLIKGSYNRWQENATAGFEASYSIREQLKLITLVDYTVNGLDKRIVKTTGLKLGVSYNPIKKIELTSIIHGDDKRRSEIDQRLNDSGIGYGMNARILPFSFRKTNMNASFNYDKTNLSNIPSQSGEGYLNASYEMSKSDSVIFGVRASETSKKYYSSFNENTNILKQIKQNREGTLYLTLGLPANLRLIVDGHATFARYLYRGNMIEEQNLAQRDNSDRMEGYTLSLINQIGDIITGKFDYAWSASKQDFKGSNLDQDTDIGEFSFHGTAVISEKDSLITDIVLGVSSFTNPSIGSDRDDWDKQTVLVNGRFKHKFNRFFSAGLLGGVNVFHRIYVSGARSANNSQNDTYILAPFVIWSPYEWLKTRQTFNIQANYITFDFDRKRIATKNRIFRRATSRSDFEIKISDNLNMIQSYYYRYEDYGQLIWDDGWQQAVSWDRKRNGLETKFDYYAYNYMHIVPFFTWEKTGEYNHELDVESTPEVPLEIRVLRDEQVKMYFSLELSFNWRSNSRFVSSVSHRLRKFNNRPRETNNYARMSVEYLF